MDDTCNCWQILSNTFILWVCPENTDTVFFRHYNCAVQCNEDTIVFCLKCQNIVKASALSIRFHQVSTAEHCGIISCSLLYQHIWSFHYKENPELSDLSTKSGQICFVFKLIRYSPLDGVVNTFSVPRYNEFCCCFEFVCILWSNIYKLYYAEQFPRSITIYTKQAFDGFFK